MNKKVLIFGAGSIGNHMANACSKLNYNVTVIDISTKSLKRMKNEIYPTRYGQWNKNINLVNYKNINKLNKLYDLIIIGTPPATHLQLLKLVLNKFKSKKILIEKPLATFREKLQLKINLKKNFIFCGYNHSVSSSFNYFFELLKRRKKTINFIDIQWRESFTGILNAHSWLKNEFSSYLGNNQLGGGCLQEHSHGLHLGFCLMKNFFKNKPQLKEKTVLYKSSKNLKYDKYSRLFFSNKKQNLNLEIDLLSEEPRKEVKVFFDKNNSIIWHHNYETGSDAVIKYHKGKKYIKLFKKDRSTEFVEEITHIEKINDYNSYNNSRIKLQNGINTLKIIKNFFNGHA